MVCCRIQFFVLDRNMRPTMPNSTLFVIPGPDKVRPHTFRACETTIAGPDNASPQRFRARLQYQAPTMSGPKGFVRYYNIRPPTMSDPTLFVRDYNIRTRQCQTPNFSCETTISGPNNVSQSPRFSCATTISGPDNVRPHTFCARPQYQAPTMSDPTLR